MLKTPTRLPALGAITVIAVVWVWPAAAGAVAKVDHGATQAETERYRCAAAEISDSAGPRRVITTMFLVGRDGYLQGPIDTGGLDIRSDIDARRAVEAVHRAEPYAAAYRGLKVTVQFKARKTCAERN